MYIRVDITTTNEQAIDTAYTFGNTLRETGWPESDLKYAKALWIEEEFKKSPLLMFLDAGFEAGYLGEMKPIVAGVEEAVVKGLADEVKKVAEEMKS